MVEYSFDRGEFFRDRFADSQRELLRQEMAEIMRQEQFRPQRELPERSRDEIVREIINRDDLDMTPAEKRAMSDPEKVMDTNGDLRKMTTEEQKEARRRFRIIYPPLDNVKRTRKKNGRDKLMSRALEIANARFRKKNGDLRKNVEQSDIMTYAHRLVRLGKV